MASLASSTPPARIRLTRHTEGTTPLVVELDGLTEATEALRTWGATGVTSRVAYHVQFADGRVTEGLYELPRAGEEPDLSTVLRPVLVVDEKRELLITGNTYPVRDDLHRLGAEWDGARRGWVAPLDKREAVTTFAEAHGLQVEDVAFRPRRSPGLFVSGNTYPARTQLAALGGWRNRQEGGWIVPLSAEDALRHLAVEGLVIERREFPVWMLQPRRPAGGGGWGRGRPAPRPESIAAGDRVLVGGNWGVVRAVTPAGIRVAVDDTEREYRFRDIAAHRPAQVKGEAKPDGPAPTPATAVAVSVPVLPTVAEQRARYERIQAAAMVLAAAGMNAAEGRDNLVRAVADLEEAYEQAYAELLDVAGEEAVRTMRAEIEADPQGVRTVAAAAPATADAPGLVVPPALAPAPSPESPSALDQSLATLAATRQALSDAEQSRAELADALVEAERKAREAAIPTLGARRMSKGARDARLQRLVHDATESERAAVVTAAGQVREAHRHLLEAEVSHYSAHGDVVQRIIASRAPYYQLTEAERQEVLAALLSGAQHRLEAAPEADLREALTTEVNNTFSCRQLMRDGVERWIEQSAERLWVNVAKSSARRTLAEADVTGRPLHQALEAIDQASSVDQVVAAAKAAQERHAEDERVRLQQARLEAERERREEARAAELAIPLSPENAALVDKLTKGEREALAGTALDDDTDNVYHLDRGKLTRSQMQHVASRLTDRGLLVGVSMRLTPEGVRVAGLVQREAARQRMGYPVDQRTPDTGASVTLTTRSEDGVWGTDGSHVVVRGSAPSAGSVLTTETMDRMFARAKDASPVRPVAVYRVGDELREAIALSNGRGIPADQYDFMLRKHAGATIAQGEEDSAPVFFLKDGQVVGAIMPFGKGPLPAGVRLAMRAAEAPAKVVEQPAESAPEVSPDVAAAAPAQEGSGELRQGTRALIDAVAEKLEKGEEIGDNRAFTAMAVAAFGGTRGQGRYTPKDAYDALEAGVNTWLGRHGARLLELDPKAALTELRALMDKLPRQTDRTEEQAELQQFSTPPTHGLVAVKALGIAPGEVLLEPSAGVGGLAVLARAAGATVVTNEIAPRRLALLAVLGFKPTSVDGEMLHDVLPIDVRPTAVLMNPPFSATGGRVDHHKTIYGARHVEHALARLEAGGRLVAIVGQGMAFEGPTPRGSSRQASGAAFREWWERTMAQYNVRVNLGLPGDEYGKYGTTFDNQLIVIDKTGPTPGDTFAERLEHVRWGRVASLEEALDAVTVIGRERGGQRELAGRAVGVDREPAVGDVRGGEAAPAGRGGVDGDRGPGGDLGDPRPRSRERKAAPVRGAESGHAAQQREDGGSVPGGGGGPEDVRGGVAAEAAPREPAAAGPTADVKATTGPVMREEEAGGTFVQYAPTRLNTEGMRQHPAHIVEAASMAAIDAPEISYRSSLPASVIADGRLSDIQYESVLYAGQRHGLTLKDGNRAGYFVGDGTGVGKGRIIAGIVLDNHIQGRRRAVWVSVSNDLMEDARRDLVDLGAKDLPLVRINDFSPADAIDLQEGVVFTTYASLISSAKGGGQSRREQLEKWLGGEGLIVFDEAHRAKNALAAGRGEPTLTGQAVVELQRNLPGARVVYVSATGATDVRNMAYMTRLGLWGEGTAFPGGFDEFLSEIEAGGVGAKEMVARELKALGMYNSRSISFQGVGYDEVVHELTPDQRHMYDVACRAWQVVLQNIHKALDITLASSFARRNALTRFWGDEQRFFKQVLTAVKVPSLIAVSEQALGEGKSVVIGLIGTGESRTVQKVARAVAEGADLDELDFTPREVIYDLVNRGFPTQRYQEKKDRDTGKTVLVPVVNTDGSPVHSREALAMKDALLEQLSDLRLPDNPLDQIVNHFGEKAVAEMTGRKRRLIRDPKTGKTEYRKRAPEGVSMLRTNVYENDQFQSGKKRIAIISEAASTGISLHASNRAGNQQRRVHITAELNWSADKQLQTFGRTHRSDQCFPPEYVLLSSNVGGEKRFSSTIARRLASLGALTKGQRDAAGDGGLAKYNFETPEGEASLATLYTRMTTGGSIPGLDSPTQALRDMGLLRDDERTVRDADLHDVPRFLNRILALELDRQNALFDAFGQTFDQTVERARDAGTFDEGVVDIRGESVRLAKEGTVIHTDAVTGAETYHYTIEVDQKTNPVSWAEVMERQAREGRRGGFFKQRKSGRLVYGESHGTRTNATTGQIEHTVTTWTPKERRAEILAETEFCEKFEPVDADVAEKVWTEAYAKIPTLETREVHVIGGTILPLWPRLKSAEAQRLRVIRATTDDGRRVVGISIPRDKLGRTLEAIGITRSLLSPPQVFRGVWEEGSRVDLVAGMSLQKRRIQGEDRIELAGADAYKFGQLRTMGLIQETIEWRARFFVPSDEAVGMPVLERLLKEYPAMGSKKETAERSQGQGMEALVPARGPRSSSLSMSR
jgi:P-loop containing NTP hydrolase pore-1/C-terminal domain on Strawberry notch homologue